MPAPRRQLLVTVLFHTLSAIRLRFAFSWNNHTEYLFEGNEAVDEVFSDGIRVAVKGGLTPDEIPCE